MSTCRRWDVVLTLKLCGDESADGSRAVCSQSLIAGTDDEWMRCVIATPCAAFRFTETKVESGAMRDRAKHDAEI